MQLHERQTLLRGLKWSIEACSLCLLLGTAACAKGGKMPQEGTDAGYDAGTPLRIATFNAGLLSSVGYVPEREPLVNGALAALDVDALCVEEFWEKAHWDALVEANHGKRPHVLRLDDHPGVSGMCSPDEFNPLQTCAQAHCSEVGASDLVACTSSECGGEVGALSSACISCLLDNASSGNFDAIRSACVGAGAAAADAGMLPASQRAYLSGGSFGIGLLSARPFAETDQKELDSSTVRRGILYAKLMDTRLGTLHVFCTHLAAIENDVKYEGSYGDWEGENAAHVQALIDWAKEKAGDNGKVLLLGDFNTGPAAPQIAPSFPDNYAKLIDAGFKDLFLSGANAACTFCSDNPLVVPSDTGVDAAIDHIMTRKISAKTSAKRILEQPIEVEAGADTDAGSSGKLQLRLSDHYGLEATIGE